MRPLTAAVIASACLVACDRNDTATAKPNSTTSASPASASPTADTLELVVADRPTVVGFFPPAKDSTEAEEGGYSEGLAHVTFALEDAEACLGRGRANIRLVIDTAVRIRQRGRTDTIHFSRVDTLLYGAYLIDTVQQPRLISEVGPSVLIHAVAAAIPEYFHRPPCPPKVP